MKYSIYITIILIACALASCSKPVNKDAAQAEIARLSSMANQHTITVQDLSTLKAQLAGDPDAAHELEELELMVKYQEYEHAGHTLGFIADYLNTGEETLCPAHELSHYYVFMKHGNTEDAEHALDEAKEQLPDWTPKAKTYAKQYPIAQNIDDLTARIQRHIDDIESGNTTTSDEEISFLANDASICVPA